MNTNLQQDLCDLIGTINPSDKIVRKYICISPNEEDAETFLSLLKSPIIFKSIVCNEQPLNSYARTIYKLVQNHDLREEWNAFLEVYREELGKNITPSTRLTRYIDFILDVLDEIDDREENLTAEDIRLNSYSEEIRLSNDVIEALNDIFEDDKLMERDASVVPIVLEMMVIYNGEIFKLNGFKTFFESHKGELKALIS